MRERELLTSASESNSPRGSSSEPHSVKLNHPRREERKACSRMRLSVETSPLLSLRETLLSERVRTSRRGWPVKERIRPEI